MTYLLMSLPFVAIAAAVFAGGVARATRRRTLARFLRASGLTAAALIVLTIVFDNAMIAAGLFTFGDAHTIGANIGLMPVEDLLYPLVGTLLLCGGRELFAVDDAEERS